MLGGLTAGRRLAVPGRATPARRVLGRMPVRAAWLPGRCSAPRAGCPCKSACLARLLFDEMRVRLGMGLPGEGDGAPRPTPTGLTDGLRASLPLYQERHALQQGQADQNPGADEAELLWKLRKYLMLLAILAAAITFQAGLAPPGGFWQDSKNGHIAGDVVMRISYPRHFLLLQHNSFRGITHCSDTAPGQGAEPQCGLAPGTTICNGIGPAGANGGLCRRKLQGGEDLSLHLDITCWHICVYHTSCHILPASGS
ncbi:unnamed protein product [Urochloa humidicola]